MRLGLSELILLFFIALILLGPSVIPRVQRWYALANARQDTENRRREARRLERARMREDLLARFRLAGRVLLVLAAGGILIYLAAAPTPYPPVRYTAQKATEKLADPAPDAAARTLDISPYEDPVCVAAQDGWLYAAVAGGKVIRIRPDGTGLAEVLSTGGDITGLCFGADGALYLTDAAMGGTLAGGGGLLKASFDGWAVSVEPLATTAGGQRLACPMAPVAAADGKVYFTEYSAVSAAAQKGAKGAVLTDLLAHTGGGSVCVWDPAAGRVSVVAGGIAGAGGLALSPAGDTLYVSESENGRVWALPASLRGGTAEQDGTLLFTGLPAYPAGLSCAADGTVYAALCGGRIGWVDGTAGLPLVRRMAMHLPRLTQAFLLTPRSDTGRVLTLSENGAVTQTLAVAPARSGGRITGVCEADGTLWLANADGSVLYGTPAAG